MNNFAIIQLTIVIPIMSKHGILESSDHGHALKAKQNTQTTKSSSDGRGKLGNLGIKEQQKQIFIMSDCIKGPRYDTCRKYHAEKETGPSQEPWLISQEKDYPVLETGAHS